MTDQNWPQACEWCGQAINAGDAYHELTAAERGPKEGFLIRHADCPEFVLDFIRTSEDDGTQAEWTPEQGWTKKP